MPITQSAKKALRQSKRRNVRNIAKKTTYKAVVTKIKKLTDTGQASAAETLLPQLYKAVDKAAKTNVIAVNKASRLKSRLSKLILTHQKTV